MISIIRFSPTFPFFTPGKQLKISGFLIFSSEIRKIDLILVKRMDKYVAAELSFNLPLK